jgi:CRISPR/Cas system type I-B associated protein Csh2 (Cas7 group RAMP superfamily)
MAMRVAALYEGDEDGLNEAVTRILGEMGQVDVTEQMESFIETNGIEDEDIVDVLDGLASIFEDRHVRATNDVGSIVSTVMQWSDTSQMSKMRTAALKRRRELAIEGE